LLQVDSAKVAEEEVYLSFRYQGVIDEIVIAYYVGDRFYLPVTELFDIMGVNYELSASALSVSGYFIKKDAKYVMDFSRHFAMLKDAVYSISANDFLVKELDFYVTPAVLNEVFGLKMTVDLSRLTLSLKTDQKLPIVVRYTRRAREALRNKYGSQASHPDYDLLYGRQYSVLDGAFLDYNIQNSINKYTDFTKLNLGIGGELLFGDIQGNLSAAKNGDQSRLTGSDLRWRYANEDSPWFSTVTVGQQRGGGLGSQTLQGVRVTNQPLTPRQSYDSYSIDGTTEPEAEIELYQNDHLVEVIHADDVGYYRFLVPLNYGTSDYKVRIYAKQGRVIELDRRIQIPFNFLPVGEVRYDLSSGRVASEELVWQDQANTAAANVTMGLRNWLTAGIGLEYIQNNNYDRPVLYSKLSSRVAGDILVGLDAVYQNYYTLTAKGVGSNTSSMSMDYTYFDQTNAYNTLGYRHKFNSNIFYPFSIGQERFTARSSMGWINIPGENRLTLNADVNQFIRGVRLRYGIRELRTFTVSGKAASSELQTGAVYTIPRVPTIHPLIRGSYFRTDISYNTTLGQFEDVKFQYIRQFGSRLKAQFFTTYDLRNKTALLELGITWDMETLRSTTTLRSIHSVPSFNQTLRGSVGLDRNNSEFIWDNRQQVGRSAVSVRMFVDDNNSGSYDDGEEIVPGNALTIEHASSRLIEKSGITRLTQLQPYRRYNFRVNEARVNNPMLVASKPKFSIITDPNSYKQLDIPFYTTGVIDGRVDKIKDGEFVPISGLRIHIKAEDGDYAETVRTFADGSFYSMEIPPGNYELWVDESQLEFLQMDTNPKKLSFTISPSPDGDYVEGLNFILE